MGDCGHQPPGGVAVRQHGGAADRAEQDAELARGRDVADRRPGEREQHEDVGERAGHRDVERLAAMGGRATSATATASPAATPAASRLARFSGTQ
jgi:hypothetical protein